MKQIDARNVVVRYGDRTIIDVSHFAAERGTVVGLVGPNGAGKTTLLRALSGINADMQHAVTLNGIPLSKMTAKERARRIAYLPQRGEPLWPITVRDLVLLGRLPLGAQLSAPKPRDLAVVQAVLEELDLVAFAQRKSTTLSGGETARVLLARALATEPEVVIADEPIAGLDPFHALEVLEGLQARAREGLTVILTLHDLTLATRFCNSLVLINEGQIAASGSPEAVLTPERLRAVYGVEAIVGREDDKAWIVPWRRI